MMGIIGRIFGREQRESLENPTVPISDANILAFLGLDALSAAGETVTIDKALSIPAFWAATNFLSGTLAGFPLHVFRKTSEGREKVKGGLANILHDAVNPGMSSFEWRKYIFEQVFTGGRAYSFIEGKLTGRITNIWPLEPEKTTVRRRNGVKYYQYQDGNRTLTYDASEIIDIPFMLKSNQLHHRSPIYANKDLIGLALAASKFGSKFFHSGGVPPFAITGPFQSAGALQRSADDLAEAVKKASKENRLALSLPAGHDIKNLGVDPTKSQLVELQRFIIEQTARIYSMPPIFLQDLTHGSFNNSEQQDLHLVKHTIKRWVEQFEQELNLKLFGRSNGRLYVEMILDGILRGDFKTRMEGYAKGIQNAVITPNEVRDRENLPRHAAGDDLLIQGATVPLGSQPIITPPKPDEGETIDGA